MIFIAYLMVGATFSLFLGPATALAAWVDGGVLTVGGLYFVVRVFGYLTKGDRLS